MSFGIGPLRVSLRVAPCACCYYSASGYNWICGGRGEFENKGVNRGSAAHLQMPQHGRFLSSSQHHSCATPLCNRKHAGRSGRRWARRWRPAADGQLPPLLPGAEREPLRIHRHLLHSHGSVLKNLRPSFRLSTSKSFRAITPHAGAGHALSMPMLSPSRSMYYAMQAGLAAPGIYLLSDNRMTQPFAIFVVVNLPATSPHMLPSPCWHCRPTQRCLKATEPCWRSLRRRPGCCPPARRCCHTPGCTALTSCCACGEAPRAARRRPSSSCCSARPMRSWHRTAVSGNGLRELHANARRR